jgi:hypothetical protein
LADQLRYQITKETIPGSGIYQPTGELFTGTSDAAVTQAETLQSQDTSGSAYSVFLLGPAD